MWRRKKEEKENFGWCESVFLAKSFSVFSQRKRERSVFEIVKFAPWLYFCDHLQIYLVMLGWTNNYKTNWWNNHDRKEDDERDRERNRFSLIQNSTMDGGDQDHRSELVLLVFNRDNKDFDSVIKFSNMNAKRITAIYPKIRINI